jgi:hypothetical protein
VTAWAAQSETVFRAIKMEAAFVDWLDEKEAVRHNNYQALIEVGALNSLMEFLAKRDMAPKEIGDLVSRIHMPIETMRYWRKILLQDRDWHPYSEPIARSERWQTDRNRHWVRDYVNQGKYCPGKLVEIVAKRE